MINEREMEGIITEGKYKTESIELTIRKTIRESKVVVGGKDITSECDRISIILTADEAFPRISIGLIDTFKNEVGA